MFSCYTHYNYLENNDLASKNITLKIDADLLESVRMIAATRDMSISELFESYVRKTIASDPAFRARRQRFRERLRRGFDLGSRGNPPMTRAAMHER